MVEIYKLNSESISKLKNAIKSVDFESNFKIKYLKSSDNGFSKENLNLWMDVIKYQK